MNCFPCSTDNRVFVFVLSFFIFFFTTLATPLGRLISGPDTTNTSTPNIIGVNNQILENATELCPENLNNDNITNIKWYRYHNESQRCYHIDERGPCGELMLFYRVGDTEYGDCDCNFYYKCDRPLIYHEPDNRCYFVNDQGPCKNKSEWFVFIDNMRSDCQFNPCLREQAAAPSTRKEFWFERLGECYRTNTIGYCSHPEDVLSVKWNEYSPTCNRRMSCNRNSRDNNNINSRSTLGGMNCLPGQKKDAQGNCNKVVVIS